MPGIEVWAQSLESMLSGNLLRRPAILTAIEMAIVADAGLVVIFAVAVPAIRGSRPRRFSASSRFCSAPRFASFKFSQLLLDGVYPALSSALVFGVMLSENLRVAEAGRRRLAAELQHEREMRSAPGGRAECRARDPDGPAAAAFPGVRPSVRDIEVFASIEPARMVGGDLYDFVLLDSEHLFFAIADVSGKGVPAALFMAMTKEVLHTATLRYRKALDRVFSEANAKISAASEELACEAAPT